jgi:hypothetical protein
MQPGSNAAPHRQDDRKRRLSLLSFGPTIRFHNDEYEYFSGVRSMVPSHKTDSTLGTLVGDLWVINRTDLPEAATLAVIHPAAGQGPAVYRARDGIFFIAFGGSWLAYANLKADKSHLSQKADDGPRRVNIY